MSKARRKKYNAQRSMQKVTTASLRNTAIAFVGGDDAYVQLVNMATNKPYKPSKAMFEALTKAKYRWSVLNAVLLRDKSSSEYIQWIEVKSKSPEYQRDMAKTLAEHHNTLLKSCNQSEVCTIAWLAVPYAHDWGIAESSAMLTALGAWDFLANWEAA